MKKRIIALTLVMITIFTSSVFAYRWIEVDGRYYVYDDTAQSYMFDKLIDTGVGVYYVGSDGAMKTGWWTNPDTGNVYFFDNHKGLTSGQMQFGFHVIDGYGRFFGPDGALAHAKKKGEYINIYGDFYVDVNGIMYNNNIEVRDVSKSKSEFYTITAYYDDAKYDNEYVALNNTAYMPETNTLSQEEEVKNIELPKGDNIITTHATEIAKRTGNPVKGNNVSGGTNYTIDDHGNMILETEEYKISDEEKYGPMNKVAKSN